MITSDDLKNIDGANTSSVGDDELANVELGSDDIDIADVELGSQDIGLLEDVQLSESEDRMSKWSKVMNDLMSTSIH